MLKKIITTVLSVICCFFLCLSVAKPVFSDYADSFELYLHECSSNASIVFVSKSDYPFISDIKGESCKLLKSEFEIEKFLNEFSATVHFTEVIDEGTAYYAYSEKIRYSAEVKGQRINLHIFIAKESVTVGSPLIYGSF